MIFQGLEDQATASSGCDYEDQGVVNWRRPDYSPHARGEGTDYAAEKA